MIGINHALTGAAIGLIVQKPLLVIPLAFLSHFLLDAIPHFGGHPIYTWGHKHFAKIIWVDGIICTCVAILIIILQPNLVIPVTLGVIFAMLPDLTLVHHYIKKSQHWFHRFHLKIQWYERPQGIFFEAIYLTIIGTSVLVLIF